jgi:hypothetical protein
MATPSRLFFGNVKRANWFRIDLAQSDKKDTQ